MAEAADASPDLFLKDCIVVPSKNLRNSHQAVPTSPVLWDPRKRGFNKLNAVVVEAVFGDTCKTGSGVLCPLIDAFVPFGEETDPLLPGTFNFILTAGHCVTTLKRGKCVLGDRYRVRCPNYEKWSSKLLETFSPGNSKETSERFTEFIVDKKSVYVYPLYIEQMMSAHGFDFALIHIPSFACRLPPNHFQVWDTAVTPDGFSIVGFPAEPERRYLPYFDRRTLFKEFVTSKVYPEHTSIYSENRTSGGQSGGPIQFIHIETNSSVVVGIHAMNSTDGEAIGCMITQKVYEWIKEIQEKHEVTSKYGSDVHKIDEDGKTSLHHAAENGDITAVRALLKLDADVCAKDKNGLTSLHWASRRGHEAVVRTLVELGADVRAKEEDGKTSLHFASELGHEAVVRTLVELGADVHAKDEHGGTSLHDASKAGHEAVVRALVELGADVRAKSGYGCTSLMVASLFGHKAVVRALVELGADFRAKANGGQTSLHLASEGGHEAVVRALVELGADVRAKEGDGKTSLHYASRRGHEAVVRALGGHEAVVRALVELGADVRAKDNGGTTSLHCASEGGHEAVVRALVELGADVRAKEVDGTTSLHWASEEGHEAVVRALVELGADVRAKEEDGKTSLHRASYKGHEAVVRALVELGADVRAKAKNGETSLDVAISQGHEAVMQALKEYMQD